MEFKAVFDASPNAYMLLDRELRYVAANPAYLRATGKPLTELLGRKVIDVFPNDPDDPNNASARLLRESLMRVLRTKQPDVIALIPYRVPYERDGVLIDHTRFWSATHTPILDEAGEVRHILQHTVDVTELQELKSAQIEADVLHRAALTQATNVRLHEEGQYLRRLVEQAPGFVCVLRGPTHVFELANEAYRQLIGHRDTTGKTLREALPEVVAQGYIALLDQVYASGKPFIGRGLKVFLQRQPGAELDEAVLDFIYQPIIDRDGDVSGIFVQGHDITEQKRLDAELQVLLERQRFLVESIPQQVWTADPEGLLIDVNQRARTYFDAADAQLLGRGWTTFLHPDDLPEALGRWGRSMRSGEPYEVEVRLRRADGEYRWHLIRAQAMRDAAGEATMWFGTNTDIDDRKRAEVALRERAEFEQQLIGIVSHDLRNPINAIGIAATLLRERGSLDEAQRRVIARISSSSDRARRLLRDFLDFTQARSTGEIPIVPGAGNVREMARFVFEEMQLLHRDRHAVLEHDGYEDVTWDTDRMAQAIGNLMANAFQHGAEHGAVSLSTRGEEAQVVIEVRNQGRPIPAADLARLFLPFERGAAAAPGERSIGLGLFISKQIVDAHGGTISVCSNETDGTVFTVRVPRATATVATE